MVRFFCRFRTKLSTKLALAVLITIFLLSFFILHCRTNVNRDAAMDIYDENQSLLRTLNTYRILFLLKLNTEAILKSDINLITVADNKEISDQHVNKLLDWLKKTGKDQNLDRSNDVNLKNINQNRDYLFNRKSFLKDFYNLSKTI